MASDNLKVQIRNVDMSEEKQEDLIEVAKQAVKMFTIEREIAQHINSYFDNKYKPTWHCIVGSSYGAFVTHESGCFAYIYVAKKAILLFKSGE